jgi:hypothetical protein
VANAKEMAQLGWLWRGVHRGMPLAVLAVVVSLATSSGTSATVGSASTLEKSGATSAPSGRAALTAYGRLPLAFIANAGQIDARVRYSAQAGGASFYFTQNEVVFSFIKGTKGTVLRLGFVGANPTARIEGRGRAASRVNYFVGSDPSKWRSHLPTYRQVIYRDLWPGIDMVFRGAAGGLKYEFVLDPSARVSDIRLAYRGADALSLGSGGDLMIETPLGMLRDDRPRSYLLKGSRGIPVASRFTIERARTVYGFAVGKKNARRRLVIDPGLVYSTYLGGSGGTSSIGDVANSVAIDAVGSTYVTGHTPSSDFPTTVGAFQPANGGGHADVFVTKLNATGSALAYSTFLGGSLEDDGLGIAVDADGSAYVTGQTNSLNFPITPGSFQTTSGGGPASLGNEVFVTKLSPTGSALAYSTYLGGSEVEEGLGIAVDAAKNAYVVGQTSSDFGPETCVGCLKFPTTPGAFQPMPGAPSGGVGFDAFVTKLNASGNALIYSSYLGGSGTDRGLGIAVGTDGTVYLSGVTDSTNFPITAGVFQAGFAGGFMGDAFVTRVNTSGSALVYSSYLGGSGLDRGLGVAVDGLGSAYLTGDTSSLNFPTTVGAFQTVHGGGFEDSFVTKVNGIGSALLYSSYLGGCSNDVGTHIAVDSLGNAHLTGETDSTNFPTTAGAFQTAFGGQGDAFVTKVNENGHTLTYSTFLGGGAIDAGSGIAVAADGTVYLAGTTYSPDYPTTLGAFQTTLRGVNDAFVTKLNLDPVGAPFVPSCGGTVGTIVVKKQTLPSGSPQSFSFAASYNGAGFSLSDGQSSASSPLEPGSYSVSETPVAGWDTSASCSDGSPPSNISLSAGERVTCTFTNTQRGTVAVNKTVNGLPPSGSQSFAFQLRQGASTTSAGTILESANATATNGGVINTTTKLVPGTAYALCEIVMPGWMTTLGPPFYVVYNPSGDNSTVCTDFSVQPGETKSFAIDNKPPPGGLARTIGFWKNWASCASSSGKQKPVLDQTLAAADPAAIVIGTLTLHAGDCAKAVRLLDKSTIDTGKKMASDPGFNLAAQFLAAKLNVVAGAGTCPAAVSAINDAQALLAAIHFNGITHDKLSAAQATQANALATTLDRYNNRALC